MSVLHSIRYEKLTVLYSRFRAREIILLIVLSLILPGFVSGAELSHIAVLYPKTSGGYEQVFSNMIQGVEQNGSSKVLARETSGDTDISELNRWLLENKIQSIIALGSVNYDLRDKLPVGMPVTIGAMVVSPDNFNGISLAGDPVLFLDNLQILVPGVKRVFIIYSKENSGWLINKAREEARIREIELIAHEVDNIKDGLKYYDSIMDKANGPKDAIWIPLDRIVPDKAILPKVLRSAWDKRFVVFSNNPLHVKQGVLFALYPDHRLMGKNLGELAVEAISADSAPALYPAKDLKIAVNKRTASHLGLHYSKSQQREFSIVFPSE